MDSGLYRIYSDNIPIFNGDKSILTTFLCSCEDLVKNFYSREDGAPINRVIINTIRSKLRGHAAELIGPRDELNTWDLIKNILIQSFADGRTENILLNDLMTSSINRNETLTEYALRLQLLRSLLVQKLNENGEAAAVKQIKIAYYEQITLKTFIQNLPEKIQIIVKCRDPVTLEKALVIVKEEETDLEFKNRIKARQNPNPTSSNVNNQNFRLPVNIQSQNYLRPIGNSQNNAQRFNWPNQPINIQQRYVPPQKFFTNKQVFGNQQNLPNNSFNRTNNVFRPNNPNFMNKTSPTPMSTTSKALTVQQPQRTMTPSQVRANFPWFKPKQTPNYVAEELHNIDNENVNQYLRDENTVDQNCPFEITNEIDQEFCNTYPPNQFPEFYTDEFLNFLHNTPGQSSETENFQEFPESQAQI